MASGLIWTVDVSALSDIYYLLSVHYCDKDLLSGVNHLSNKLLGLFNVSEQKVNISAH